MSGWILWGSLSSAACIALWFREVRRIMRERKSMLESAASQLSACRVKAAGVRYDPGLAAVLLRSESIYHQALELYRQELKKPLVFLPAVAMGFGKIPTLEAKHPLPNTAANTAVIVPVPQYNKGEREPYFGSVRFFKNMILLAVVVMISIPTVLSFSLGHDLDAAQAELTAQQLRLRTLEEENAALQETILEQSLSPVEAAEAAALPAESPYAQLYPDFYAPQSAAATVRESGTIYLTFDDGPSERTGEILDILQEKNVKATFFVIGSEGKENHALLRRIVDEGHTLGMHSYSHKYAKIYESVEAYLADMYELFCQIRDVTGVTPSIFRFPGGSINGYNSSIYQELIAEMLRRGFIPYDWNISSEDATMHRLLPSETLTENVIAGAKKTGRGIVLMHDSAAKTTTVEALGPTIDQLRELGLTLKPLTPEVMPILYAYSD